MSTSAISSTSPLSQQLQQYFKTRQSDLQQLGQALNAGDAAGAQTAFNNIVTLGQNGPLSSGNPFLAQQRETDFSSIGQALQSGNIAGAQAAFASLVNSFKPAGPQLDPAPSAGSSGAASTSGPDIVLNLSGGSSSAPEQITVNIANSASGGEQISLSVGNQGSSAAQQINFNLPANSNEQIVLNLLNASPSTSSTNAASGSSSTGGISVSA